MSMEEESIWSPCSPVAASSEPEEIDQVWAEEIILEEDGSPVKSWRAEDVFVVASPKVKDEDEDLDFSLSLYSQGLTEEEDCLLEESFHLMEDLEKGVVGDKVENKSIIEKAQDLLDHLDQIKQEPFADWLEGKTELPFLEELGGLSYRCLAPYQPRGAHPTPVDGQISPPYLSNTGVPTPSEGHVAPYLSPPGETLVSATVPPQQPNTPALIREFESVLNQTLTPPHTPPTYIDLVNNQEENNRSRDLSEEELDAIINSKVASLYDEKSRDKDWNPLENTASGSGSVVTEDSDSACLSSCESDPDWSPASIESRNPGHRNRRAVNTLEERKQRKKEQNKNAATRYRLKKKAEHAGILDEESVLLEKNVSLKEKATELQREVKCLKSLMRDIFKAQGLLT